MDFSKEKSIKTIRGSTVSMYETLLENEKRADTIEIKVLKNVSNPNSVHGIFPYRGKISAVDAALVLSQFKEGSTVLDPFCGTGTIVYEARKMGLKSFGVDLNPIANVIASGKINMQSDIKSVLQKTNAIIEKAKILINVNNMNPEAKKHFHLKTSDEIMRVVTFFNEMDDYLKSCLFGAISLTARGCNGYLWTSTSVGKDKPEKNYINFYDKFLQKVKKHHYPVNNQDCQVFLEDSRNLSKIFLPNTFDYVFTSPPYFDCLDYTSYYSKIIYNILNYNRIEIKSKLIQNFNSYELDMRRVLNELYIVCKTGAKIIFVVGDKKIHNKVINGAEYFKKISPFKTVDIIERTYAKTSSKVFDVINKTDRKEQIIVWEK